MSFEKDRLFNNKDKKYRFVWKKNNETVQFNDNVRNFNFYTWKKIPHRLRRTESSPVKSVSVLTGIY